MRITRFSLGDEDPRYGVVEGTAADDTSAGERPGETEPAGAILVIDGDPLFRPPKPTGERIPLQDVRLLAPVIPRSKVVCVGRNYAEHAAELGNEVPERPLTFLKPNTSVIGPGDGIRYPEQTKDLQYEGELGVVIGRICKDVPKERVPEVIFGYVVGNDVTARDLQKTDGQWMRAKGFDTFCPLGPWIETELDPTDLAVTTTVNGELRQSGRTAQFIFDIPTIVAYVTSVMTLLPGDVILTGTPAGVGPMHVGDRVDVTIEGIGTLTNQVIAP